MTADKPRKGDRRKYYGRPKTDPRGAIKGPGIFITTPRGLESRAVREAYDILNDICDRYYPDLKPAEQQQEADYGDSIEDAMEAELKELQKNESAGGMRFESRKTQTDCLAFIMVAKPYDPVKLVELAVQDLLKNKVIKSKAILRLTPVSDTCHSSSLEDIEALARRVIGPVFQPLGKVETEEPVRFKINITMRNHTKMQRMVLIPLFAGMVHNFVSEPDLPVTAADKTDAQPTGTEGAHSQSHPQRNARSVKADLEHPELIVVVEILRNTCGVSVVDGPLYEGPGKRFNLDQISAGIVAERGQEAAGEGASEGGAPKQVESEAP